MGRLQRIENTVNSSVSHFAHTKIFPRGLPRTVDPLLRGTVRFAKRTGNSVSVLNPDNTFDFGTVPKSRDRDVILARESDWMTEGAIISLGPGKELHRVEDVIDNQLQLESEITQTFTEEDQVLLHSYPMKSSIDTVSGATTITVKSHYQLGNGDVLAYLQTQELLQSLTEVRVVNAVFLGTTSDTFFTNLYSLELESSIERDIPSGTVIYQRAYPAYFSSSIRVPNALFTAQPTGPFLIDVLGGMLVEGPVFRENLSIRTTNRTGNYVLGSATSYVTVEQNHLIMDRIIDAQVPKFWDPAQGTKRSTPNRVVFRVDENNQFVTGIKCVPHMPADKEWRISALANEDCTMRFHFKPHPTQEFTLLSGIAQTITVTIPPGDEVTDIEINILGTSDICEVRLSDWTPTRDTVEEIEYNFIVEAAGQATYQAEGLQIKPFFLGRELLRGAWNIDTNFDGGKVWL